MKVLISVSAVSISWCLALALAGLCSGDKASADVHSSSPCDAKLPSSNPASCSSYYGINTALSLVPSDCPAGQHAEKPSPYWWDSCKAQTGPCPEGCGTCKKPNYSQDDSQCMCAGMQSACTAECGYPGMVDKKKCAPIPCQQSDPEAAGCIDLGDNCGGDQPSECVDAQGTVSTCTFPSNYFASSSPCKAFCKQIPNTQKCETVRNSPSVWVGMGVCPAHAITQRPGTCADDASPGVTYLPSKFNDCQQLNEPYPPLAASHCVHTDTVPQMPNKSIEGLAPPTKTCPTPPNRGSQGFPALFTNLLVPSDASVSCQTACACNENEGIGPPSCYFSGEPYPGPAGCCYCDGKNVAYDKTKFDTCGHYLPIFGPGTVPSQAACYSEYALNPDHPGLVDNFPKEVLYECVNNMPSVSAEE
jgi:hypothetical protein